MSKGTPSHLRTDDNIATHTHLIVEAQITVERVSLTETIAITITATQATTTIITTTISTINKMMHTPTMANDLPESALPIVITMARSVSPTGIQVLTKTTGKKKTGVVKTMGGGMQTRTEVVTKTPMEVRTWLMPQQGKQLIIKTMKELSIDTMKGMTQVQGMRFGRNTTLLLLRLPLDMDMKLLIEPICSLVIVL